MEFVFDDKIINCMDEDVLLDTFQTMYNQKKYVQCVLYIEKKLSAFSSKFYDVMIIYLYSLINSNNKEKALKLVKEELSMPYIPALYEDRFKEIYQELSYKEKEVREFTLSRDKIREILETNEDKNVIILAIVEMCKLNIRDFLDSIQVFFKRNLKNIYKVMLIDALRSQGVNREFNLVNDGITSKINPIESENILESEDYSIIKTILEDNIGKQDPNLLALASENLMLYLSDIFPKKVREKDYEIIAYSIHLYSLKMYGEEVDEDELALIYKIDKQNENKILSKLQTACSI
jgi:hypothetical protein